MDIVRDKLEIIVTNSGKVYTLYFRTPDIDEWLDFSGRIRKAINAKTEEEASIKEISKIKLEGAELILTGVEDNQFGIEIDGRTTFITSALRVRDPSGSETIEGWKSLLGKYFYYLLFPLFDEAFARRGEIYVEKK
jgi:hypothetical protein